MPKSKRDRRKESRKQKQKAAKGKREIDRFLGGIGSEEESGLSGGGQRHSPPKVDAAGVPLYGRSLISTKAMEILRRQGRIAKP